MATEDDQPLGRVITFTSGKGGVGKTTTTANVGAALAARGRMVLLIDADLGLRNLDIVLGLENRVMFDLVDIVEGACRIRQAIVPDKRLETLFILPAAQTRDKDAVAPNQMEWLSNELRKLFDYVLIDSPAGIERGFQNAIAGADEVIVVTNPEVSSVRDADRIVALVDEAGLPTPRLIVNRINPVLVQRGEMMSVDDVSGILGLDPIGAVPNDDAVISASNRGEPLSLDKDSRSGGAFRDIAARIDGEDVPLDTFERQDGRVRRFFGFLRLSRAGQPSGSGGTN